MLKKTVTAYITDKLEEYETVLKSHSKRIKMIEQDNNGIKQTFMDLKKDIGLQHNELLSLINRVLEKTVVLTANKSQANKIIAMKDCFFKFSSSVMYVLFGAIVAIVVQLILGS